MRKSLKEVLKSISKEEEEKDRNRRWITDDDDDDDAIKDHPRTTATSGSSGHHRAIKYGHRSHRLQPTTETSPTVTSLPPTMYAKN